MIQSLNHRTTAVILLVSVLVCIYTCTGCTKHSDLSPGYNFAEVKGQLSEQNQINTIRRLIFIGTDGRKAAFSEIVTLTDLGGHHSSETRFLHEYLYNDTLFIFDSADSTCIRLALANTGFAELNLLPFSAWWIFTDPGKSESTSSDTLTICGFNCKKKSIGNGYLWKCADNTMAIETSSEGFSRTESIIRTVSDTILPKGIFVHPLGYRELVPAGPNNH